MFEINCTLNSVLLVKGKVLFSKFYTLGQNMPSRNGSIDIKLAASRVDFCVKTHFNHVTYMGLLFLIYPSVIASLPLNRTGGRKYRK